MQFLRGRVGKTSKEPKNERSCLVEASPVFSFGFFSYFGFCPTAVNPRNPRGKERALKTGVVSGSGLSQVVAALQGYN